MALSDHVFLYCERGANEGLFAEPFNAASNGVLAGLDRRPKEMRSADNALLIALVLLIGLGSLAFHRSTCSCSSVFGFALNRFLDLAPGWTTLTLIGFAAIVFLTMQLKCWGGGIGFPGAKVTGA
jgi:hypothetical protein